MQAATGVTLHKRYSFCERETAPATLEQAHKLSARVSPIAAPAVTEGEKVAANGWKENARWMTFVRALTAASGRGRRIADFYRGFSQSRFFPRICVRCFPRYHSFITRVCILRSVISLLFLIPPRMPLNIITPLPRSARCTL